MSSTTQTGVTAQQQGQTNGQTTGQITGQTPAPQQTAGTAPKPQVIRDWAAI